jgi:hypothetical protein
MNAQFITYNLFLDDDRDPHHCSFFGGDDRYSELDWIVVRSHCEFMETILERFKQGQVPSLVSFDYNLNTNENTGLDSVVFLNKWCKENSFDPPECLVHSNHLWGKKEIWREINAAKKQ